MTSLTLGFAGTPSFGLLALEALYHSTHQLKAIYTQPDRPAGRGRKLQASPIKQFATTHGIPCFQPINFKNETDRQIMRDLELDVLIVIAYGLILPQSILSTPRYGCINVHASLLPRWRGASPIQQSILHGDSSTGVTIMQMDKGLDTGDMLCLESIEIAETETSETLHNKLAQLAIQPLLKTLEDIAQNKTHPQPQPHDMATYAPKLTKAEAHVQWSETADVIDRKIRAYQPWPIAYTYFENQSIRIHQAQKNDQVTHTTPGTITRIDKTGIFVSTQTHTIQITHLQSPGGKVLAAHEWIQSHPFIRVGAQLT